MRIFPSLELPCSKGGTTRLGDTFAKGPTIVGVVPRERRDEWLAEAAARITPWMLEYFANVYLIVDISLDEARAAADRHGLQAPLLSDVTGAAVDVGPGFYLVGERGEILERLDPAAAPAALADFPRKSA